MAQRAAHFTEIDAAFERAVGTNAAQLQNSLEFADELRRIRLISPIKCSYESFLVGIAREKIFVAVNLRNSIEATLDNNIKSASVKYIIIDCHSWCKCDCQKA
jgi:hypothetical protein